MLAGVPTGAIPIVPELRVMRARGERKQRATFFELFFDLVYVFAITQLSHHLLANLSWAGAAQTVFMLVAVYWAWNYTTWMTNWFDPDTVPVRLVLVFVMLASLLLAVAIPAGFGGHALLFACAYAGLQIGRNTFVVAVTPRGEFNQNFRQILALVGGALVAMRHVAGKAGPSRNESPGHRDRGGDRAFRAVVGEQGWLRRPCHDAVTSRPAPPYVDASGSTPANPHSESSGRG